MAGAVDEVPSAALLLVRLCRSLLQGGESVTAAACSCACLLWVQAWKDAEADPRNALL